MSKNTDRTKKGRKTIGGVITTILVTIIVIIASLLGIGENEAENLNDNIQENTEVVSESHTDIVPEELSDQIESQESEEIVSEENDTETFTEEVTVAEITFRNQKLLDEHYDKHGIEMGFASAEEYELAAYMVIIHPDTLHKIEAEDGDDVYYREETNEFVVVSKDGYIRTYFYPNAGIDYYNRQ